MSSHFVRPALVVLSSTLVGCAVPVAAGDSIAEGESVAEVQSALAVTLDPRRSVVVTDVAILNRFSLAQVLQRLVTDAGSGQTPAQVLVDWATARRTACGTFNGFPEECANSGSSLDETAALNDPSLAFYKPIALTNRFDLASATGADCGEYRVAFSAASASMGPDANFLIFEARLPNPSPQLGLEGCRPVAQFWANLSTQANVNLRADALHSFYFSGLPGFMPVVDVSHYAGGAPVSGQIRLNARLTRTSWTFMEFRSVVTCDAACSLKLVKSTTKAVPFPALAGDVVAQPLASAFQSALLGSLSQVGSGLLANRLSDLSSNLADKFNIGRVDANQFTPVPGVIQSASPQFKAAIQSRLSALGSPLTSNQLLGRVQSLTCGGCHNFQSTTEEELGGGLSLPSNALNANPEMLSTQQETGPDGPRFLLKPVIATLFMPERLASLTQFVNSRSIASNLEAEANDGQAGVQFQACTDVGGGQNAGFISNGSFVQWSVNVPVAGNYAVTTRSATWATASLQILLDGKVVSPLSLPPTWSGSGAQFQTWRSFTSTRFPVSAGVHTLKILFTSGNQNLNYVRLQPPTSTSLVQNGTFASGGASWVTNLNSASISYAAGFGDFTINTATTNSWDVQLTQGLALSSGTVYTLCYDIKSNEAARTVRVSTDGSSDSAYANRGLDLSGIAVTTAWLTRSHTFAANLTDASSRIAFDFGRSASNVQIDNVKLFVGTACQ